MQKAAETGTLTKEQERGMTAEQKAALEKQMKERSDSIKKNKALNDEFNSGEDRDGCQGLRHGGAAFPKSERDGPEPDRNLELIGRYLLRLGKDAASHGTQRYLR